MKIYEIGTGYTSIPAQMGAATEIVVEEMTKSLTKLGEDVTLIDIKDKNRAENSLPIKEVWVPSVFVGTDVALGIVHKLKRVVYSVCLALKLKRILKHTREKVVFHFHNQYNLFFFLKLTSKKIRKNVKIAYTVHSYIWPREWEEIEETVKSRYFQEIYCVQNADCVLVLNDKTTEHFVKHLGVDENKIHKIKNGVNTDTYSPLSQTEKENFKQSVGLGGKKIIFQVGSVCDRKNQLGALKELAPLLKQNKDIVYAYAGGIIEQEYADKINQLSADNGIENQVIYVGELAPGEQLNKYYSSAAATIFPSKLESFGMVIIESLSAATSVVLPEKPIFGIESGYSIYRDGDELVKIISDLVKNESDDNAARQEVIEKYSWDTVTREHLEILK